MPTWQVEKVLSTELGHNWKNKLATFEDRPFAAASIGNYHIFFFFLIKELYFKEHSSC